MKSDGIQLLVPMAGEGRRFADAGVKTPKPLIDVGGVRMFELVLDNLVRPEVSKIVLVVRSEFGLEDLEGPLSDILDADLRIICVDHTTGGPAETVLIAEEVLASNQPVVVANSDQYVEFDMSRIYQAALRGDSSGIVLSMEDQDPKWSYVKLDPRGNVLRIEEKQVVSPYATVGIYAFAQAAEMFQAIRDMRDAEDRVNGELYVGPAYNYLDRSAGPVRCINLGPVGTVMHGLGIPGDLNRFLADSKNIGFVAQAAKRFAKLSDSRPEK